MTCYALIRSDGTTIQPMLEHMLSHRNDATAYSGPLRPSDIASVYGLPAQPSAAAVPTVAIVDAFDDPNAEADLSHYRQWFHLPPCTSANGCFKKLNAAGITGSYPAANAGWAGEIALDLDVASATCPACRIVLVEAADNGAGSLASAEDTAASLDPSAISNSYGGAEYENASEHYHHPNTMIVASTGDDSYYGGPQQPASYGTVIAAGGTSLYRDAASARGWDEFAWSNGGSGCSKLVARPSWQDPNVTGCGKRAVADVAAFADPFNPGVWVWNTYAGTAGGAGGWYVDGGTSAAAPLIAGIYALAGNTATLGGSYAQSIYTAPASSFFDIIEGNNGYCTPTVQCSARTGYDEPTGRGSPNGLGAF
jgi:subtilase family serine protease